jgi:hypothetical protein
MLAHPAGGERWPSRGRSSWSSAPGTTSWSRDSATTTSPRIWRPPGSSWRWRAGGLSWEDLGLSCHRLPAGLRWGGACSGLVACGYAVGLAVPGLRPLLTDARVAGLDGSAVAHQVLVRIPLGTVLWEEVAFRGVLPVALAPLGSVRAATATSAVVFGIWYVRPTSDALRPTTSPTGRSSGPSGSPCSTSPRTPWGPEPPRSHTACADAPTGDAEETMVG